MGVALVAALLTPAVAAAAPVVSCTSTLSGSSLIGPVEVPAGSTCTLVNVVVVGAAQVTVDGTLIADNGTFGGALVAHGGSSVQLNGAAVSGSVTVAGPRTTVDVNGGKIGGALNVTGPGVSGQLTCPLSVVGAVTLRSSAVAVTGAGCGFGAALTVIKVPLGTAVAFAGTTVGGAMSVTDNQTEVDLGPLRVGGALVCLGNVVAPVNAGNVTVRGATVGQCSGIAGTGTPRPPGVRGPLSNALLSLSPSAAGPEVIGAKQTLTATLRSPSGPIAGQVINLSVKGANPTNATGATDAHGTATFSDAGIAVGVDRIVASAASPGGTIYSNAAQVTWVSLANAKLTLTPTSVPNDVVGTTQVLTATLTTGGTTVAGQTVAFTVTGANPASGTAATSPGGSATFSYRGSNAGADTAVAKVTAGGASVTSPASHLTWIPPVGANVTNPGGVSTSPVQGNFFVEPASAKTFAAKPGDTPAFAQSFPDVEFNPPAGTIPGEPAGGPTPAIRPFTDVTTDEAGGYSGTIPAAGGGFAAGQKTSAGDLTTFDASFTGFLNVAKAEDLTLQVTADDGYLLGVGGGATAVTPTIVSTTATATPFKGYPLDGAYDQAGTGGPSTYQVTVHLPAAGSYPYELDYLSCCDKTMSLTLGVVTSVTGPTEPYNLYAGYADNTRPGAGTNFPNPWQGAPGSTFDGSGSPYDTGGLRFDNTTTKPLTVSNVTVDIGSQHYAVWNWPQTVSPGAKLILAGTKGNFQTDSQGGTVDDLYWTNYGGGGGGSSIGRGNLDGTGVNENFITGAAGPVGVAVDNAHVYWTNPGVEAGSPGTTIGRANLDGTGVNQSFIGGVQSPHNIAVNGSYIYWDNRIGNTIGRANIDGTGVNNDFITGAGGPWGIAIDGSHIYWTNFGASGSSGGTTIGRANLDGTGVDQSFITGASTPAGVTVDGSHIYWANFGGNTIGRANIDGINIDQNFINAGNTPAGITVNGPRIYWDNFGGATISQANIDGTNINPNLVTGANAPLEVAVGPGRGSITCSTDPNVFNTGYDAATAGILPDLSLDANWKVAGPYAATSPLSTAVPIANATPIPGVTLPFAPANVGLLSGNYSVSPFGNANWISQQSVNQPIQQVGEGDWYYRYQFNLDPSVNPALFNLQMNFLADNDAFEVYVNGVTQSPLTTGVPQDPVLTDDPYFYVGYANSNAATTTLNHNWAAGLNTIDVQVKSAGGAEAFEAQLRPSTLCPPPPPCTPNMTVPVVHVTVNGTTLSYSDTRRALTGAGIDGAACGTNVSQPWQQLAGATTIQAVPLPPAVSLSLNPASSLDDIVNSSQTLRVSATDQAGHPADAVPVTLSIAGANPQTLNATTDSTGTASFSYTGTKAGTDTASASTIVAGAAAFSNEASIGWTIPVPPPPPPPPAGQAPPTVTITSPTNGQALTGPVAVTAVITPPAVSPIATWSVIAQPVAAGAAISVANRTGTPPSQLGTLNPGTLAVGTYSIVVTATTAAGARDSAAAVVTVASGVGTGGSGGNGGGTAAQAPPTITNISPADGSVITMASPVAAVITAPTGESIASWSAGFHASSNPVLTPLGSGSGASPASLGTFDPTLLPDDIYLLQITATVSVAVTGALKPGRYVTTFKDLSIPVSGFTADVTRVYDSYDKSVGAFGVGWHLGASDYKVSVNDPLGAGGWSATPTSCGLFGCQYAFTSSAPHYATVTFPDGHQEIFDFTPAGGFGPFYFDGSSGFTARAGSQTSSTLAVDPATDPQPTFGFNGDLDAGTGDAVYAPTRFVLSLTNGTKLLLDQSTGLVSETDPHGNKVMFDTTGIHATNAAGTTEAGIAYTRDTQGRVTQVTGPTGQKLAYTYSPAGDLASVTDPVGNITTFSYDVNHDLLKTTGPGGPLNTYTYDATGRLSSITDANGHITKVTNNLAATQQIVTDPLGVLTTLLSFDANGNIITTQASADGVSRTTTKTYDPLGDVTSSVDPLGGTTFATFDAQGNQTSATDALGNVTTTTFGPRDEVLSKVDAAGRTTKGVYDASGNLTALTEPRGATITTTFDDMGNPATITDELGNTYTLTSAASGQPATVTDPLGQVRSYEYDASGNETSIIDPANAGTGHATTYAYDADNRQISVTDPLGHSTKTSYDALGNVASTTTANGNATAFRYDQAEHQTQITDPDGGGAFLTYDADGQRLSTTDAVGHVERFTYDGFGEKTSTEDAATGTVTTTFDADRRVISTTDARGDTVTSAYDADGNLTSQTAPDVTSVRTYDADAELTSVVDPTGTTTYTYDANGQITSVASPQGIITYAYDATGNRGVMTLPSGTITYSYDADGNEIMQTALGQTLGFTYNSDNQLGTITRPDGVSTRYNYDADGLTASVISMHDATILTSFMYTRDRDGNPTSVATPAGITTYTYDKLDRLLSGSGGNPPAQSFTYDAASNITSVKTGSTTTSYAHTATGQLSAVGSTLVQSDAAGDITKIGATKFGFDALGRLTSATGNGTASAYTYNARNLRVSTGTTTTDLWDQVDATTGQLAMEPQLVSDGLNTFLYVDGQILGQVSGTTGTYYLADALGTIQATTAGSGTLTETSTYAPFGQTTGTTGIPAPFGFTGQIQDPNGLVFLRSRYLDPEIGQFLTPDSVQPNAPNTIGFNLFSYASDNPAAYIDPSGHDAIGEAALAYFGVAVTTLELYNEPSLTGLCDEIAALRAAGVATYQLFVKLLTKLRKGLAAAVIAGEWGLCVIAAVLSKPNPATSPAPPPLPPMLPMPPAPPSPPEPPAPPETSST